MAGKTAILAVKIISDASSAKRGLADIGKATGKASGAMGKLGAAAKAGMLAAGAAIAGLAVTGIKAAADLEQSVGAVDTVFKGNADQMHAWADQAATSVGLTKNEYNELATVLGTQLKNGGTSMDQLGTKTNELVELGADLASMFGGTTADAVGALSSALKGERDPIERYGVSLKQTQIDAKAAAMGFEKVGGSLSNEAQQAATLALIMEQTSDAHGNFAKEADTVQGQMQRLKATWGNFTADIGTALLPIVNEVLGVLSGTVMPAVKEFGNAFKTAMDGIDVSGIFNQLGNALRPLGETFRSLLPALAPLGNAIMGLVTNGIMPLVQGIISGLVPVIQSLVSAFLPPLIAAFQQIIPALTPVLGFIGQFVAILGQVLVPVINTLAPIVTTAFSVIANVISSALSVVSGIIQTVTSIMQGNWSGAWNGMTSIVSGVWGIIRGVVSGGIRMIGSVIRGAAGLLAGAGQAMMQGLINGVKAMAGKIFEAAKNVIKGAIDGIKGFLGIHSPSRVFAEIGRQTGAGLVVGINAMQKPVAAAGKALAAAATPQPGEISLGRPRANLLERAQATAGDIIVNINGGLIDRHTIDQLIDAIDQARRRSGRLAVAGRY